MTAGLVKIREAQFHQFIYLFLFLKTPSKFYFSPDISVWSLYKKSFETPIFFFQFKGY